MTDQTTPTQPTNAAPVAPAPLPQSYAIPPMYPVQIQGTGGYPSRGAGLISGLQAGQQLATNFQNSRREQTQYQTDQYNRARQERAAYLSNPKNDPDAPDAPPDPGPAPGSADYNAAHPGIADAVVQGAKGLVSRLFGGSSQSGGSPAAPAQSAIPQPPPGMMGGGAVAPSGQQAPPMAFQKGGQVPHATPLPFLARPAPGTMGVQVSHQAEPGISGYEDGGPVQIQGTGGMPSPGAGLVSGMQAGQQIAGNAVDAARGNAQYAQSQHARATGATAAQTATTGPKPVHEHVDDIARTLQNAALNDANVPSGTQGVPVPAPQVPPGTPPESAASMTAAATAAQDPAAKQGVPQQSPTQSGKPHSLTPEWWDNVNHQISLAAASAAAAGQDPNMVYHSLTAMRNSFFQGEVLKNLSAANVALLNGDNKATEQAIRNVYYYFPDGQDLQLNRGKDGALQYQDPMTPWLDDQGKPTTGDTGKKNMVDVTAAHLQLLGQAALDPMQVATTLQQYRQLPFNQQLARMKAQSELLSAQGTYLRGTGINTEAQANMKLVAGKNVKNLSDAELAQARAQAAQYALQRWQLRMQQLKLDPTALRGAQQAGQGVEDMALGKTAMPIYDKDGNMSLNPRAGQMGYDPQSAPKEFRMNSLELGEAKALAGDIYITNAKGGMSAQQASQLALQMHAAKGKMHPGPDGKPQPDAYVDRQGGTAGIWNPATKKYQRFAIGQESVSGLLDNGGKMPEDAFITGAMSGGGTSGSDQGFPPASTIGGSDEGSGATNPTP